MALTKLLVGWRIRPSLADAQVGYTLLLFAYALSWLLAVIGAALGSPDVFGNAILIAVFPLTFVANTFIATGNLPPAQRAVAEWNSVLAVVQTVRIDFGNISPTMASPQALSLRHPVAATLAWVALTLAVWRCRKAISR